MEYKILFMFIEIPFIIYLLVVEKVVSVDKQYEVCVPKNCGTGPDISYPFWINGSQESFCGFPGFGISCNNREPILKLAGDEYIIREIVYETQTLSIAKAGLSHDICYPLNYRVNLNPLLFTYAPASLNLSIFFNCTSLVSDEYLRYSIGCTTDTPTNRSLALFSDDPEFRNVNQSGKCGTHMVIPVDMIGSGSLDTYTSRDFVDGFLTKGFHLKWNTPRCDQCAESGGRCGFDFDIYKFMCFCSDRPHLRRCKSIKGPTESVKATKITYTVLGTKGWIIPPGGAGDYANWAATKNFTVGDSLLFNFTSGVHDVAQVTKEAFDSCTTTKTIGPVLVNAPANITLRTAGKHYYICTVSEHCSLGQKLAIDNSGSPSTEEGNVKLKLYIVAIAAAGTLAIAAVGIGIFCCLRRKKTKNSEKLEAFLKTHGSLSLKRYKYSHVRKMTNLFKDKLGHGGYGSVYKGKLPDGRAVAVKVLSDTKGNGDEFINEVASISRTSHVNVVALLGFCVEGRKRALIYEFVPNGSLEKFIFVENPLEHSYLGWKTLYSIAVGVAKGLEYLHKGCHTRILHFDIKPHNILLEQDFNPKISDFGLAKLCLGKESIISMTGGRGTNGYVAPEVVSRNFGGVSHKSDVYSYGMMVLEMVGGRKNIDVGVTNISEIYFPHWIYKQLNLNEDLGLHGVTNLEDEEITRKMILVGLWCVQIDPSSRPAMGRVLEMLEGSLEALQIPPKPFPSSPARQ